MEERLNIGGMLLTKLFGQAETDADTFAGHNRAVMDLTVKQSMVGRWLFFCLAVFSVLGPAAVYCYGGVRAIEGAISLGTIIAFVAYLSSLYRPRRPARRRLRLPAGRPGGLRAHLRVPRPPAGRRGTRRRPWTSRSCGGTSASRTSASRTPRPARPPSEGEAPQAVTEEDRRALKEICFEVLPGQRVALVGPSGAGKTTITYLLPRFYDPEDGAVTVDGHDLRSLTQDSLRRHLAAVTQDTFLFHATIRDNLLYARPEATEEEIVAAARAANIHDFIADLSDGYETVVGERGFRLSGGEKQRLAIARALLKDPAILVLDEATSSLDATSEFLIQKALEKLLEGRTSLIIAHRLSTILTADKIIVLDRGRIVQTGHPWQSCWLRAASTPPSTTSSSPA